MCGKALRGHAGPASQLLPAWAQEEMSALPRSPDPLRETREEHAGWEHFWSQPQHLLPLKLWCPVTKLQ